MVQLIVPRVNEIIGALLFSGQVQNGANLSSFAAKSPQPLRTNRYWGLGIDSYWKFALIGLVVLIHVGSKIWCYMSLCESTERLNCSRFHGIKRSLNYFYMYHIHTYTHTHVIAQSGCPLYCQGPLQQWTATCGKSDGQENIADAWDPQHPIIWRPKVSTENHPAWWCWAGGSLCAQKIPVNYANVYHSVNHTFHVL